MAQPPPPITQGGGGANYVAHFLKIVNNLLDKHAPYKTIKYSKPRYENMKLNHGSLLD